MFAFLQAVATRARKSANEALIPWQALSPVLVGQKEIVMKSTSLIRKTLLALGLLLALPASSLADQAAAPGWALNVHATNVSTVSGGEALAADLVTGNLLVKSLQDPSGLNIQLARVTPSGTVTILATFPSLKHSDISGISIDPLSGGIIVADGAGGAGGRIVIVDLSTFTVSTLFDVSWVMNPGPAFGTGQQQYASDPGNPNILYFWDSTLSKLFRLDRSTNILVEILALDQGTSVGGHFSTFTNDIVFDVATGTLLVTDNLSSSILEVDPSTSPPTVTTLFSGITGPVSIALNLLTSQVFVVLGFNSISVGPRTGGSLSPVASGFSFLTDIAVGNATAGTGLSLFAVDKTLDTVYEITPSAITVAIDIKSGSFPNSINPRSKGVIPVAILTTDTFDATTVDPNTIAFGPDEAFPVHAALKDVDGDGDTDVILHFNTQATGIQCGDTSASLTGETFDGQMIEGSDSIKTTGCK
jgi:hypothetical protein